MADTKNASKEAKTGEKVKLSIRQIKADLDSGVDRKGIRLKYGLNSQGIKQLFQHPELKGLKVKAAPNFVLVDDNGNSLGTSEAKTGDMEASATKLAGAPTEEAKGTW